VALVFFRLAGQEYTAINGGPQFPFTEAVSFTVNCEDQDEVDRLWSQLTADGGEEGQCGWLKDRFGLSWQIIAERMGELLSDPDPGRAQRAMQAMLKMQKIDVQALEDAANGS
jgi:predicted 3-demethylubiquinone-9 3-methyltransferase (glyoxalase superfamily)